MKSKKIETIQSLRFFFFLLIFFHHLSGYFNLRFQSFAAFAVTFFIVLSGFCNGLSYQSHQKNNEKLSLKNCLKYAINKSRKLYPLYVILIILYLPLSLKNLVLESNTNLVEYLFYLLLNVFLMEAWIYKNFNTISYSGWYLSILAFLEFVTLPLVKLIRNLNKNNKIVKYIIMILFTCLMLEFYIITFKDFKYGYFFYVFPIFRIFEYFIGLVLSFLYYKLLKLINFNFKDVIFNLLEIISIIFLWIYILSFWKVSNYSLLIYNIIVSSFVIFAFAFEKGYLSTILKNKLLVFLGNISGYMYLIHNLVIAYGLGIATRIFDHNLINQILFPALAFVSTVFLSYIVYRRNLNSIKNDFYHFLGFFKKRKLKCKNFTIISNNCFGGVFYRNNALEYLSPTCGLFIMPKDYIKFIYSMDSYLNIDLVEISIDESSYSDYLKSINYKGTIGKIDDIEIMFMHYNSFKEAKEKWVRRSKRINYNRIIYKFNDQNNCTYDDLLAFQKFPAKNKLCFTAKKYKNVDSIVFSEFQNDGYVINDSKEKIFKKYIDMYKYINERFGEK